MVLPGRFEGVKVWTIWKDSRGLLHIGQRREDVAERGSWLKVNMPFNLPYSVGFYDRRRRKGGHDMMRGVVVV
jgi:hypothetical protein